MKWMAALGLILPLTSSGAVVEERLTKTGTVRSETIALKGLSTRNQYSLLYSLSPLRSLGPDARAQVEVRQGPRVLASKTLHAGDADYYTQFRVAQAGPATVEIRASGAEGTYRLQVNRWPASPLVKSSPNHQWQDAMAIPLGK